MTFLVAAEGLVMYFLSERYASFWGYGPLDPVSSFATIAEGYSLVMVGAFWVRRGVPHRDGASMASPGTPSTLRWRHPARHRRDSPTQACLLRKTDVWKAYGAASIVYFLATVDATFIRKYELDVTEVGTEVDLVLSFVAVVATEAWTVIF
jgi:hypothetical protein